VRVRDHARVMPAHSQSSQICVRVVVRPVLAEWAGGVQMATKRRWSARVNATSDALDLEPSVFKGGSKEIARSLKRSADRSKRRKSSPFRSAMSMLTFYENRAGKNLSASRKKVIDGAKRELRRLYGKESPAKPKKR
jgi:hypothetical protein